MYQAIIYKEWIKTRKALGLTVFVFAAAGVYSFMKIGESVRSSGLVSMWETALQKDMSMFPYFEYLPLFAGILLAITQYAPELQFKRLKLTLHLPLPESKIQQTMLGYGFMAVLLLVCLAMGSLLCGLRLYFPREIVSASFWNLLPWFLAGLASYAITSWVCLEPQWKQRILNIVAGLALLSLFFIGAKSGAYSPITPYLTAFVEASFFFSIYSITRFKEGIQ
ncbi:MAG: hypothetical protein LBG92_02855 [Prevotellaceae bacterium]|jgi:hypothetical protein|nr:hypothetical protein [Prevotellaceae bacterium]